MTVKWAYPDLDEESEEFQRTVDDEGFDAKTMHQCALKAMTKPLRPFTELDWRRLENTDSYDISLERARELAKEYGRNIDQIVQGFENGEEMPAPIVLERPDGSITLIAGNTRLMVASALVVQPKVLWVNYPR